VRTHIHEKHTNSGKTFWTRSQRSNNNPSAAEQTTFATLLITVNRNLSAIVRRERDKRIIAYSVYTAEENPIRIPTYFFVTAFWNDVSGRVTKSRTEFSPHQGVIPNAFGWGTRRRCVYTVSKIYHNNGAAYRRTSESVNRIQL